MSVCVWCARYLVSGSGGTFRQKTNPSRYPKGPGDDISQRISAPSNARKGDCAQRTVPSGLAGRPNRSSLDRSTTAAFPPSPPQRFASWRVVPRRLLQTSMSNLVHPSFAIHALFQIHGCQEATQTNQARTMMHPRLPCNLLDNTGTLPRSPLRSRVYPGFEKNLRGFASQ